MSDTKASIGYGSVVELADPATPTDYDYVAEVGDITPPSETTNTEDATNMQSPNRTMEFIEGLSDPGEFSFDMNLVPGSPSDLLLRAAKGKRKVIRQTFNNGCQLIFFGIRQAYDLTVPVAGKMAASVTFKVSGDPTLTGVTAPRNVVAPVITGVAQVGAPLVVDPGVWAGAQSITFQWEADGAPISGATGSSFIPQTANIGDVITCVVNGANTAFDTDAETAGTAAVVA